MSRQKRGIRRRRPLQPTTSRVCDNEVSEPNGLGRSSPRERSRGEEPRRARATARPLTREASVGRAPGVAPKGEAPGFSVATRDQKLGGRATVLSVRGVRSVRRSCSWIDSVAEVDRRRAAPRGRERRARGNDGGSSFPVREHRGCEKAPEADSRRLSRADRWRVPTPNRNPRKRVEGTPVDGRRSGLGKPIVLTHGRWKESWLPVSRSGFRTTRGATWSVRGALRQPCRGRKRRGNGSAARSGARRLARNGGGL
jgi:hypothetical protein